METLLSIVRRAGRRGFCSSGYLARRGVAATASASGGEA